MTTPSERTRALVWGGGFLIEVARDASLPLALRRKAATIARHFPTIEQIASTSSFPPSPEPAEVCRDDLTSWGAELQHGPLKESTRIPWPEG
ncbi:BPSL0761 family protein [Arenimonas malthae]|uniref:BPSL0761 family protein n=1 Tax=Arenimonas malthae TaxID=354197 RepID=UPI000A01867C